MKQQLPAEKLDVPFVNEERLNLKNWMIAVALIVLALWVTPRVWKHLERFQTGIDYRIPYALSRDYWLYQRRLEQLTNAHSVVLLGDSVVWGEYVLPGGTLSHFLNVEAGGRAAFINGGVNGLFPLAMEGLVEDYAEELHDRKIILHCNLLWMSSPRADLQTQKEERFNHSRLVPQFFPRIPCYKASANERLSAVIERHVQFMSWVTHLQSAYFGDRSIPLWTLADDGSDPPRYPNTYKNPLSQITMVAPAAPTVDPLRGPASPRHKPWTQDGGNPVNFDWVAPESSLQWEAFQQTVKMLRSRGNDILVILGPFNEHMISRDSFSGYQKLRSAVLEWLREQNITHIAPEVLPSELYADASHPLTEGYALLAKTLYQSGAFRNWIALEHPAHQPN
jgi:hypothetical protein